jgi:hypothetical protein
MEFLVEGDTDFLNMSFSRVLIDENDDEVFLTKHVESKALADGNTFTGEIDTVTGDLIHGTLLYHDRQLQYEGHFSQGKRHGDNAVCKKLDGSDNKFVGSYKDDQFSHGTLITKEYTYSGDLAGGDFGRPVYSGMGLLAYVDKTVYEGEFQESQYEGHGVLTTPNGDRYDGRFSNGKKSGLGTTLYEDGSSYTGDWELDLRHGKGVMSSSNNDRIYRGEFQYDEPHGLGTYLINHVELKGAWNQGRPVDGAGWRIRYLKSGLVYKGQTVCGKPHGPGSLLQLPSERMQKTAILYSGMFNCGMPVKGSGGGCDYVLDCSISSLEGTSELSKETTVQEALSKMMDLSDQDERNSLAPPRKEEKDDDANDGTTREVDGEGEMESCQWSQQLEAILDSVEPTECLATRIRVSRSAELKSKVTISLMDGSVYSGMMKNGTMEGPANFTDAFNNSMFTGSFLNGLKHGEGEERYIDGTVYKGGYSNGWREGTGEIVDQFGELVCKGEWKDDKMHGKGICKYSKSALYPGTYQGDFKSARRHGRGILKTEDGTAYEGDWCNDNPQFGDWIVKYPSGAVYMGSAAFEDNSSAPVSMGFGSQREPDGTFYTGNFLNGKRHGAGVCLFASGETYDGEWDNDNFVKFGREEP